MVRRPTNSSLIPCKGKIFVPSIKLPRSSLAGAHRNPHKTVQNGSGWSSYQLLFGHQYIKQTQRLYCCIATLLYCYTAVLLYCYIAVLLNCCIVILLYCCTAVLLYCYIATLLYCYIATLLYY